MNTKVTWATDSVNPFYGCQEVSEACRWCYARGWAKRCGRASCWGSEGTRTVRIEKALKEVRKLSALAVTTGVPRNVFVCSLGDFFEDRPEIEAARDRFLLELGMHPMLRFLLLTKRPGNIVRMVAPTGLRMLPGNVWLGTTAENQRRWDERVPVLLEAAATLGAEGRTFVSCEPLLGEIDIWEGNLPSWVIVGCLKVGGRCPVLNWKWVSTIVVECGFLSVPVFLKQVPLGGQGGVVSDDPEDLPMGLLWARQVPQGLQTISTGSRPPATGKPKGEGLA